MEKNKTYLHPTFPHKEMLPELSSFILYPYSGYICHQITMSDQVRAPQSPLHKKGENAMVLEVFESKELPVQMD